MPDHPVSPESLFGTVGCLAEVLSVLPEADSILMSGNPPEAVRQGTTWVRDLSRLSISVESRFVSYLKAAILMLLVADCTHAQAGGLDAIHIGTTADFYVDNTEYSNPFRDGETFIGAYSSLYLSYCHPSFDLSLGGFFQREFGDEHEVSKALPLLRFRYLHNGFTFTAGFLDSTDNHGLPDALLAREYPYIHPVEEGFQIQARYGILDLDLWLNWYLQDTSKHREFFASGFRTTFRRDLFILTCAGRVSHHGGQLHDNGLVSDSLAGLLRIGSTVRTGVTEWGLLLSTMGDIDRPERPFDVDSTEGYGLEGEVFVAPWGWKLYYRLFSGNRFRVEQGNPMYQTEKPFHRFGLERELRLGSFVRASLQAEGVSIESRWEYDYSLVIKVFLDLLPFQ